MSVLTRNKNTLYSSNIYRYKFKGIVENEQEEKIVILIDKQNNLPTYRKLTQIRDDERILNQIEPTTAFDLGCRATLENLSF